MNSMSSELSSCIEDVISKFFYRQKKLLQHVYSYGLQSPLWFWSNNGDVVVNGSEREKQRLVYLINWMLRSKQGESSIALIIPDEWKLDLRKRLAVQNVLDIVHIYSPAEFSLTMAEKNVKRKFDVVLYSIGLSPLATNLNTISAHVNWMKNSLCASNYIFIVSGDIAWTSSVVQSRFPDWKKTVEKLEVESLPISTDEQGIQWMTEKDTLPSLIGKAIPLCCSIHPNQRFLDYGNSVIEFQCQRYCLQPFSCGNTNHICQDRCHSLEKHTMCPYRCDKMLSCGHKCLRNCSLSCDCYEKVEVPLSCYHEVPIGIEKETSETIYARVNHVYRGHCGNASSPCHVEYSSECAQCLGPISIMCFEATELGHSLSNRTIMCDGCHRIMKELRAEILGSMLFETERTRKKLRVEIVRTLHQQNKAADRGLFAPGERVEIVDSSKCVAPLFEDDFPNIKFFSLEDPNFISTVQGTYATFVSSHVDTIDVEEVRNLVRLPNGLHVLVTDGGLRLIRPATKHVLDNAKTLLLTYQGPALQTQEVSNSSSTELFKMVGKTFYLPSPYSVLFGETERVFTDCLLTVVRTDNTNTENVIADIASFFAELPHDCKENGFFQIAEDSDIPSKKIEAVTDSILRKVTFRISIPASLLESTDGFNVEKNVYVTTPAHQITDTVSLNMITEMARDELHDSSLSISVTRMQADTRYTVLALFNAPIINDQFKRLGPVALLRGSMPSSIVKRSRHRRIISRDSKNEYNEKGKPAPPLFAIPFMFTRSDDEAEAEAALDTASQEAFQKRLSAALEKKIEDLAFRNDEKSFLKLEQLPPVVPSMLDERRVAYSVPVPLPSELELAKVKQSFLAMPTASADPLKLLVLKDTLEKKKEQRNFGGQWVNEISQRLKLDKSAESTRVRVANVELLKVQ